MTPKLPRWIAICTLAFAALWLARAGAAPTVTFELDPPNPVAGQTIRFRDTSPAAATSWLWDFGDGTSATTASPSHAWSAPGQYVVRLLAQDTSTQAAVTVSAETTLRLLAAHPFEITIDAKDPGNGSNSPAQAIAISDRFGWFSFPGLTSDPGNPEVTVKVLEAPTFGHYWIFWSAMTSLQYTMTVRDVTTGQIEVYEKNDSAACGGWDTLSFPFAPTPTPSALSPTPAAPTATPAAGQPTSTRTRTLTPTATPSTAPTITPTPGPTQITLRASSYSWAWCPSGDQYFLPCVAGACPYEIEATSVVAGQPCNSCVIHLHAGCSYSLTIYNGDSPGGEQTQPHNLPARDQIGLPAETLAVGVILSPITLSIPAGAPFDVSFSCTNSGCANGSPPELTHEHMVGLVHVDP